MKALVTGGNGFIGSNLVDRMASIGHSVTVIDRNPRRFGPLPQGVGCIEGDLGDERLLQTILRGNDVVYHLAWATIHESSNQDPIADAQSNLLSSIRLIQACHRVGMQRMVFLSSGGTVYGLPKRSTCREVDSLDPICSYGIIKVAVEKYLQLYNHLHGLDFVILRPSVPYGPGQDPRRRQGAVAVFLHRVSQGLPVTIWGDGTNTRDYFYISDLVEGMLAAADFPFGEERVFNLGGGDAISLKRLMRIVEATVGKRAVVEYRDWRKFDVPHLLLDTSRARRTLRWSPKVSLEEGVTRTWSWLSSQFGDVSAEPFVTKAGTSS